MRGRRVRAFRFVTSTHEAYLVTWKWTSSKCSIGGPNEGRISLARLPLGRTCSKPLRKVYFTLGSLPPVVKYISPLKYIPHSANHLSPPLPLKATLFFELCACCRRFYRRRKGGGKEKCISGISFLYHRSFNVPLTHFFTPCNAALNILWVPKNMGGWKKINVAYLGKIVIDLPEARMRK